MLDIKDFSFFEKQNSFDFKSFLIKIVSYWKWFLVSFVITFSIAHQVNIRKQKIYGIGTTIAVKEENNPFFTSTTSLVFNWGGTSDKVQMISTTLKSRSHNELVVDELQFYTDYLVKTDYYLKDVYGQVPFKITVDKTKGQLLEQFIKVKLISSDTYQVAVSFPSNTANLINYSENSIANVPIFETEVVKKFRVGQEVNLPFLNWKLVLTKSPKDYIGKEILIRFNGFDETVNTYKGLEVEIDSRAGSIIRLGMQGTNKALMVDYLNATVLKLIERQLEQKNKFADNTIAFIDETLLKMEGELKDSGEDLKDFSRKNNILDIEDKGANFKQLLTENDIKKQDVERKLAYLNALKTYLNGSVDFSKLPAPTVAGIDEPNIVNNVAKLISLSIERSNMVYSAKGNIFYERVDNEIMSVKKVLLENANSLKNALQYDLRQVDTKLSQLEGEVNVRIQHEGQAKDIIVKAGEMFLLPANTPHSPARGANTIGLVIERVRKGTNLQDGLMWFCEKCNHHLHTYRFPLENIEKDFLPRFREFYGSEDLRTCKACGHIMEVDPKFV